MRASAQDWTNIADPQSHLLPIACGDGSSTMVQAIEATVGRHKQACNNCGSTQERTGCLSFTCPKTLCCRIMSAQANSLDKPITFPEIQEEIALTIPALDNDPQEAAYQLKAVICHIGKTLNTGHYIAYSKRQTLTGNEWHYFDDAVTRLASTQEATQKEPA